jgi:mono/diheme cytochrome c family protein
VNKQVNYIVSAHLILAMAIGTLFIANKLPPTLLHQTEENPAFCGTTDIIATPLTETEQKGKALFSANCASCHKLGTRMTGPDLLNFEQREPWTKRKSFYEWLRDPAAFMKKDAYTRNLRNNYGTMMTSFPHLTREEMDAIADYVNY